MDTTTNFTFWIIAWCWIGLAFITAALAVLLGAKGLDKHNKIGPDQDHLLT